MRRTILFIIISLVMVLFISSACVKKQPTDTSDGASADSSEDDSAATDNQGNEETIPQPDDNEDETGTGNETGTADETDPGSEPEETPVPEPVIESTLSKAECSKRVAVGVRPPFCTIKEDGTHELIINNSGFVNLSGIHIELKDKMKDLLFSFDKLEPLQKGAGISIDVPVQNYAGTNRIEISPIENNIICDINNAIVIYPESSCK